MFGLLDLLFMFRKVLWQLLTIPGHLLPFLGSHFVSRKTPSISTISINNNVRSQFIKSSITLPLTFFSWWVCCLHSCCAKKILIMTYLLSFQLVAEWKLFSHQISSCIKIFNLKNWSYIMSCSWLGILWICSGRMKTSWLIIS